MGSLEGLLALNHTHSTHSTHTHTHARARTHAPTQPRTILFEKKAKTGLPKTPQTLLETNVGSLKKPAREMGGDYLPGFPIYSSAKKITPKETRFDGSCLHAVGLIGLLGRHTPQAEEEDPRGKEQHLRFGGWFGARRCGTLWWFPTLKNQGFTSKSGAIQTTNWDVGNGSKTPLRFLSQKPLE